MLSHYLQERILDLAHNLGTPTIPATVYVGLSSTAPQRDGTGITEPTIGTNAYARVAITQASDLARSAQEVSNVGALAFAAPTGAWLAGATLAYFHVRDAASAGNLLWYDELLEPRVVAAAGGALTIAAGALTSRADIA